MQSWNPRKHWAGGQPLRRCPFYAGCGAGGVAGLQSRRLCFGQRYFIPARQYAPVIFGMRLSGYLSEMAADGFRTAFILFRELCGGLFTVADVDDEAPFRLTCFEPQKAFFASRGFELLKALQRKAFRDVQHAFFGNGGMGPTPAWHADSRRLTCVPSPKKAER